MSLPADKALLEHWYPEDFQEFRRIVYRAILMILDLTVQFKIRTSCQNKIWLFGWHSDIKELHVKCQYFKLKKLIVQDIHVLLKWLLMLDEQCITAVELHIWIYCTIKIFIKYENFVIYHMYKFKSRSRFCLEYSSNDFLSICSWLYIVIHVMEFTVCVSVCV